ncbi:PTS sugar transporter subunit IIB [Clostridium tarantellae]|uniref:PTS maltose transporter subunit IIBC n=1 Tax=Clostridium tarantellae TaxID=39493 RepID=A0A6I1MXN8_9CLOT|nr:PTS sugar transporter subunit IIB [Clostridium tarantellae]MPQ44909.1 PTS maltose transporter subunit IIBC [Clostridium tarantellae]
MKIITVCGNGIGSSLMLATKIEELCREEGMNVDVECCDFNAASGKKCDLYVTVKELADQFDFDNVAVVRSYVNRKKIREDILSKIKEIYAQLNK